MATASTTATSDGWFIHFLRYLVVGVIFSIPIIGWVLAILAFSKTGYRKRDVLLLLIPILNIIIGVRVQWRYAAKSVYWSVRSDRPSSSLFS